MQRSNEPVWVSGIGTPQDALLYQIKQSLQSTYWSSSDGVYNFQFISNDVPLTNTVQPHAFQLWRSTPTYEYDATSVVIQGRLNNDGSFEYGGGRLGRLVSPHMIVWNDGQQWTAVKHVSPRESDKLDLFTIRQQAYLDSAVLMGQVYTNKYLY